MLYILNTGQITQLMKLGANEVEVAGSFSKRVLFWVLSSVDPMRRISTSWLKRPRGLLSFMFSHWKKLALNVPRGTDKGGNIRRCRWPWEHSPVPTVSRTDQSQASLAGLLMNVERKHSRLHERTPPPSSMPASCPFLCGQGRSLDAILQNDQNYAQRATSILRHCLYCYYFLRALTFLLRVEQPLWDRNIPKMLSKRGSQKAREGLRLCAKQAQSFTVWWKFLV